jgi:FAS-associated factor 2
VHILQLAHDRQAKNQKRVIEEEKQDDEQMQAAIVESEQLAQLDKEKAEQLAQLEKEKTLEQIKAAIPAEPEAGSPNTVTLQFKLPDNGKVVRRFLQSDVLQVVLDYVRTHDALADVRWELISGFPRKVYGKAEAGNTLVALSLAPRAALIVRNLDA